MAAMLAGLVSYDVAYLMVVLGSAGILWLHGRINLPLIIAVAIFAVITIAIPTAVLGLKRWSNRQPIAWLGKLLGVRALFRALAAAPTDLVAEPRTPRPDDGTPACDFHARRAHALARVRVHRRRAGGLGGFVAFAIASMAATIGPMPVGLGTFEAGSVGMLHFLGVPSRPRWPRRFCYAG